METLTDQNWLLTVGTFLPLVGVLVMMFWPKDDESTHKGIGIVTAGATLVVGIVTLFAVRLRPVARSCSSSSTPSGSR